MLSSVAVLLGGLAMKYWGLWWIDTVLSISIAVYLIVSSWRLFIQTLKVLMQFTPSDIDLSEIAHHVNKIEGVLNIHHIHVWQLTDQGIWILVKI
jgi:cobalt-zinc-cadmium efflux system protein